MVICVNKANEVLPLNARAREPYKNRNVDTSKHNYSQSGAQLC